MTIRQRLTAAALLGLFGFAAALPGASAIADDVQWDKTFYDVETGETVGLTASDGATGDMTESGGATPPEEATLPRHIIETMEIN
ncbi:MAG: hypothetical protein IH994_07675 [Proteobacteria bacterium]|nr:hypothetical protein [Pseudomonadota bacterium]